MEPVTHLLTGAAISRAGLNRKTALATLTLVLAAEFPDIDMVFFPFGRVVGFGHHRGMTHTLLGAPFVAAAALGLVYLIHNWQEKRRARKVQDRAAAEEARRLADPQRYKADDHVPIIIEPLPIRWRLLYVYALIGVLSHLLLDFTNSYGVRIFAPFNWRWYSWDIVSIVEFAILIPLALAMVAPWFFQLMGSELGAKRQRFPGRPSAIAALIFMVLIWWVRDYNHRRAITLLKNDVYSGQEPSRVFAGPYTLNPFRW